MLLPLNWELCFIVKVTVELADPFLNLFIIWCLLILSLASHLVKMSLRIRPPDLAASTYERYCLELKAWEKVTEVVAEKRGVAVALSLPQTYEGIRIRDLVFNEVDIDKLVRRRV